MPVRAYPDRKDSAGESFSGPPALIGMLALVLYPLIGGAAGFAYHRFIGCRTGACLIWSNPWAATIYGAVLGLMLAGSRGGS